ncbi:transposase domain-containing protein, partial [Bradyrhizobium sp. 146]|uniref:transposase domain-containing protein n=1 Tax=Bradyrhizobium sp. 146 TaxID=2782622 RepID=UPI001FF9DB4D
LTRSPGSSTVTQTAKSISCFPGPIARNPSKPWPENDAYAWLRHVLTELPQRADDADITDLLPFNFPKTAAA